MESPVEESGAVAVAAEPDNVGQTQSIAEPSEEMVPLSALQAERRSRQQYQEQNKLFQDHMALLKSNQAPPEPKQEDMVGLADEDVLTVGEAKKLLGAVNKNYQSSVEELRVQQKYSDYNDVVTQYLPDVVAKNPSLKSTLENDPNRYELAYYLAKQSDSYREKTHETKKSTDAKRIIENGQRAGTLSAVGSAASQSNVGNYKAMSDSDFIAMANKNLGRF